MSITHEVTIWCDGPDCAPEWVQGIEGLARLRRTLKADGWVRKADGRDLCPACKADAS